MPSERNMVSQSKDLLQTDREPSREYAGKGVPLKTLTIETEIKFNTVAFVLVV